LDWRQRTYCGRVRPTDAGREVLLMGWVDAVRDHGSLIFVHLRDVSGIVQLVFDPAVDARVRSAALGLREEFVIQVRGKVRERTAGTENPNLETGDVEVYVSEMEILAKAETLPFKISEKAMVFGEALQANPENVDEELRLRFRYLDIRRPSVQANLRGRYEMMKRIRQTLDTRQFVEVETPILTRSTPEGARDYLVPSRIHQGRFYALPQSPQLFKQLLMMGGMDRYFQITRCFRDEDLRPNRQPEFTQLDLEASFVDEEFIHDLVEEITVRIFEVGGITLERPFPRMTYDQAMESYGTDRPDLRFALEFQDVTDVVSGTSYTIFRSIAGKGGCIKGFRIPGAADRMSKNLLQNEYAMKIVPSLGGKGMTWMKHTEGGLQSNIVRFFSEAELEALIRRFGTREGDVLMMVADLSRHEVNTVLGRLRLHVAEHLSLVPDGRYCPVWVTDFPLFELKDERISSMHHPFTMPGREDFDPEDRQELLSLRARAYDLVVNGEELGGGSVRIHRPDLQRRVFRALGLEPAEVEDKFGFFLEALGLGAPPHAGLALGLDRMAAMVLGARSIREVIAFPKNRRAFCPLTRAPADADPEHLQELGIRVSDAGDAEAGARGKTSPFASGDRKPKPRKKVSMARVRQVAKLARLSLREEEMEAIRRDLEQVLGYVDQLAALDTEGVPPMSHVLPVTNVWREDGEGSAGPVEEILSNAPERNGRFFQVPKILEG